jgi:uncharacterized membrane protein
MNNQKGYHSSWIIVVSITVFSGLLLIIVALLPFETQKIWIDSLATDGEVESYTHSIYRTTRFFAAVLAAIAILGSALLLIFRDRTRNIIGSIAGFLRQNIFELKNISAKLRPGKKDLVPLAILAIIIGFAVFFRYVYLWRPMGHDETYTFMEFASRGLRTVITDYHLPNNHVFHTILVNLAYILFGDSPPVIRLPAFLAGLMIIPATYLVARIFSNFRIALVSASIVAALQVLIDYATTARGYTIITLLGLLILALGSYVKDNKNYFGWFIIVLFSSLGLYTTPTMLYPIAMVFTWLLLSKVIGDVDSRYGRSFFGYLIVSLVAVVILSGIFYSPIIASSGLESIIGNSVVEALSWGDFTQSIPVRVRNTWAEWNRDLPNWVSVVSMIGLGASFIVPKHAQRQRILLTLAGIIGIGALLLIQRVAPWPRIWIFLLPLFVIWISTGIIGIIELLLAKIPRGDTILVVMVGIMIAVPLIFGFMRSYFQYEQKLPSNGAVEQMAIYLQGELNPKDVVVVTSPDSIVLRYYLRRLGIPDEVTNLKKGKSFTRAVVVVNKAYGQDLPYVLDRRSFLDDVDLQSAQEIHSTKRFTLYQLYGE